MALLDEGETDWKVIVVDVQDPLASRLNDIEDVERHLPGLIRATNEWFRCVQYYVSYHKSLSLIAILRIYKIPDGKPENAFAFSGEAKNKKYATEIIHECHEAWRRLVTGECPAKTASYDLSMFVPTSFDHLSIFNLSFFFSRNITQPNSPGFIRRDDPTYTSLPPDSRKPPAPIDPSGELSLYCLPWILLTEVLLSRQCQNGSISVPCKFRTLLAICIDVNVEGARYPMMSKYYCKAKLKLQI